MLELIQGRAGTGKTAYVLNDIRLRMEAGETGLLLIVPEQYSHDAERQLCAVCGDALSMHGETLSFTRLCGRVFLEMGAPARMLDSGGQMLVMHRALESTAPSLKVYGTRGARVEILENILETVKELKSLNIFPKSLESIASAASNPLADKLHDLALIYEAYDALLHEHGSDASDRLTMLADVIGESSVGSAGHIYFDGFNDFTAQELRVIEELLRKKADLTVCLTYDPQDGGEVFELPRKTAGELRRLADDYGVEIKSQVFEAQRSGASELAFLEKHIFDHAPAEYQGQSEAITICRAPTRYAECEYAAQKVLEYIRSGNRWRDISIIARDWEAYDPVCEIVFEKHGIPFFASGRTDILSKPPTALIEAALDIAVTGWEYRPVFRYIKTGLMGIQTGECAQLENYVLKWNIRGAAWMREWKLPPSGYGGESDNDALQRLNSLRLHVLEPLLRLKDGLKGVSKASQKLRALYSFLEETGLAERLKEKTDEFEKRGERRLADEYTQLWDVVINAMEQVFELLGDIFSKGSWALKGASSYIKRYRFRGHVAASYKYDLLGERGLPNSSASKNFSVNWMHTQDPKANI